MSNPPIIFGLGGVVVGIFIGVAIGGSIVTDKINDAVSRAMARAQENAGDGAQATQDAILVLGERIGAMETSLSDSSSATQEISEAMRAQLDQMRDSLGAQIDTVRQSATESTAELRAALDSLTSGRGDATRSDSAGGGPASQDTASADAAPVTEGAGMSARVGETVIFADGAVRAFVSRVDAEGGMARIAVNGELSSISVGEAVTASVDGSECSVGLTAVEGSSATLNSDCGGASGGDAAAAAESAPADIPAAPEEGFRAGETVQLSEGLRVFVSGLAEDRSSARIAVNGLTVQTVAAGDSVDVPSGNQTCTITVTGVGDGMVGLEGSCG